MEHTVTVRIGNAERSFNFSTAKDKEESIRFRNEAVEEKDKELDDEKEKTKGLDMDKVKNAMDRLPELEEERKGHLDTIEQLKKKIEEVTDPENQEKMAKELLEDSEKEEAMTGEMDDKDKADVKNCAVKNRMDRKKIILGKVLNKKGMNITDMSDETVNALFAMEGSSAVSRVKNSGRAVVHPFGNKENTVTDSAGKFFGARFGNKGGK
jgi:seryl-tRNA synthetase